MDIIYQSDVDAKIDKLTLDREKIEEAVLEASRGHRRAKSFVAAVPGWSLSCEHCGKSGDKYIKVVNIEPTRTRIPDFI